MRLPNVGAAVVEMRKITGYLLSEERSGGKAAFFMAFGFAVDAPEGLRSALLAHAGAHAVAEESETVYGVKYIIEGEMQTPDGRSPVVRSVWIVETGTDTPRLVTAYPVEGETT